MPVADQFLRYLEFKILRRLDGVMQGDYSGVFYGPGLEIGEVREYQTGDDVRFMDWNVTARTGRAHVRQFIEEREITAWLVVDLSQSIAFGTTEHTKRDVLREFAGVMARLYTRHGNNVGLLGFGAGRDIVVPPRSGRIQTLRILDAIDSAPAGIGGETDLTAAMIRADRFIRRRSVVLVVSDFLVPSGWERPLRTLSQRHDVIAVRLVDPREEELPNIGMLLLEDPESGEQMWIDTSHKQTRDRFKVAAAGREKQLRSNLVSTAVDLITLSTAEPTVEPLLRFAAQRKRRGQWKPLPR